MQSFYRGIDNEDVTPSSPTVLSYLRLPKIVDQSIYFLPFDHPSPSRFLFSSTGNDKNGLQSLRFGANWSSSSPTSSPTSSSSPSSSFFSSSSKQQHQMTQDEWGCQVSENGISAHFSRARTLQQQQQQLSGTDAHNNKFENHVDNVVFHGVDPIVFCRIKSAPYPHVLLSARLVDFQRFHLFSSVVVKRGCPIEFVIQPILRSKLVVNDDDDDNSNKNNEKVVWTDRVGLELYGSTVTRDSPVPTTVLMNLNRLTPSLRAGFELGWSGSSVSNAGLSVNYRKVWSQKAGCQVDWTLRQTYLGQTDLYMLNQLSPRLITAAHFCYNSTNYSSQYGLGLIWNVMEKRKAENHSQITSSTVGVRWSSEKGWGIRWNADIGEHATAGISLGGLSLDGGNALDDMKIGIHFKGSF